MDVLSNLPIKLGLGLAAISGEGGGYGFGDISEIEAIKLLDFAFESGVRLFDTAPIYGFGESERRLGLAFTQKREKIFIVNKCGVHWHQNKRVDMNNDPVLAVKMLEDSLKRLQTEYIDLYMIHWPDKKWDIRRPMEALAKAKAQGKILHIGLCNTTNDDYEKASQIEEIYGLQSEVNLFNNALSNLSYEKCLTMGYGTLDKGILSGRVVKDRKYDKVDARSWAPWWNKKVVAAKIEKVARLSKEIPLFTPLQLALNYSKTHCDIPLCGARSPSQLQNLIEQLNVSIPSDILAKAKNILND